MVAAWHVGLPLPVHFNPIHRPLSPLSCPFCLPSLRVLLEAGADFLKANDEGKTPCEAARERGNHDCTALLEVIDG